MEGQPGDYDAFNLGPLKVERRHGLEFRRDVLKPFFDQYRARMRRRLTRRRGSSITP